MFQSFRSENQNYINEHLTKLTGKEASFFVQAFGSFENHQSHPIHRHSFLEICYILSGTAIYSENGVDIPVAANSMLITPPGIWHNLTSDDGIHVLWAGFDLIETESSPRGKKLYDHLKLSPGKIHSNISHTSSAILWRLIYEQSSKQSLLPEDYFGNLMYALLISLCDAFADHSENPPIEDNLHNRRTSSFLLYQARQFIRDNLSQDLQLDTVASYLHVSGRHLSRVFSNNLSVSFSRYVREEKMKRAASLLTTTNIAIKEISEEIGFETVQYFTKIFSKEIGIPPGRYRAEHEAPLNLNDLFKR